ncbi:MAG TPA: phosphomannomutase/phosphoglucomutase [Nitrospiria bacterium]|nr:phosphomannomutase/phosphoglucomutase [Nitrospiria bacterium]
MAGGARQPGAVSRIPAFKVYDIRGTVPDEVNSDIAWKAARAFADWSGAEEVIVGRDARLSSPSLAEAVIDGLVESGVTVRDVGIVTTPILNIAVATHRRHGMMITASHNPKVYNGIKLVDPSAQQIYYGRGLEAVEAQVASGRFADRGRRGRVLITPVLQAYQERLFGTFQQAGLGSLSVVIDCSNGVGGLPLGVLERLGVETTLLNHIPDGNFPHHDCDTLRPDNLRELRHAVRLYRADLGVMFDGDADRVVFVDEEGDIAPIDRVFALLARQELTLKNGRIFYDLRFSRAVREEIEARGGVPVTLRVGNPFYKEALHQHDDGLLAGDLSGHFMYKEHACVDDALFAALKLMAYLVRSGRTLSALLHPLQRYAGSGELRILADDPGRLVERVKQRYRDADISELDGVSVRYADWWMNLRPSNTEPVAKLVMEASSVERLEREKRGVLELLQQHGGHLE